MERTYMYAYTREHYLHTRARGSNEIRIIIIIVYGIGDKEMFLIRFGAKTKRKASYFITRIELICRVIGMYIYIHTCTR